jgi:UDP-N-acetylmuramoyl-L-alanyl-D-glutamate--2,6-diaminopimelate ligase
MSVSLKFAEQLSDLGVPVIRLVTDSRAVQAGDTFVAYPGEKNDGRGHIAQAIAQGTTAVIWESQKFNWDTTWQVANMPVADLRQKSGWLADVVYGKPSESLWMVGVTGTNGKTSISHWIAQVLSEAGKKCAMIGTLGNGFAGALQATVNTTPDAIHVHGLLAQYREDGAQAVAMEVSSHALAQGRVNGVYFDVALLTNLTRDHLDYHGDMQVYSAAKRRLFDWKSLKYAVVNLDDVFGAELALRLREKDVEVVGYGLTDAALQLAGKHGLRMVKGHLLAMNGEGMRLGIHSSWGVAELNSALIGRFNAANLLGALAVLLVSDIGLNQAVSSLSRVQSVAGRMQRVSNAGQPAVIVDYAHTPDALEKVLLALRELCDANQQSGRLICLFGCGGDRDRGKRAMMGQVAEKFADHCIVTSDNPRSEDPEGIISEIVSGMTANRHEVVIDRAEAIRHAIEFACAGDIVLLAGKGHENYQEIHGVKHEFSDQAVAVTALNKCHMHGGVQ